ncbi:hypothetical protein [Falsiroseomonas oryzae]|uniref:hypothetical protein n=1 Tax=Falsiroseomonas oryzae TaxID=2766473 RepID=UPI0022EAB4F1|nr:hypothetical protein [Roseomonas sp. MO-31]
MDLPESLMPHLGAVVGLLAAVAAALAARHLRRGLLFGVSAGIGVLAGWWFTFGLLTATPRQLPERLPLLMLVLVMLVPALGALATRWRVLALPAVAACALWVGWWMSGAPTVAADLQRAAPVLIGTAAATTLLAFGGTPRWAAPVAAASLVASLAFVPAPGPQLVLATAALAAAAAAAMVPPPRGSTLPPPLAALPLAGALTAVAALPVMARGTPADWAIAAAPIAALWVGAPLGGRVATRLGPPLGAVLAGGAAAALAGALS